jgi:hypothetical protein
MKKYLLLIVIGLFTSSYIFQTDPKEKAIAYFDNYNSKNKMNALILKSFATLEDAKKIFNKPEDAVQFMKLMEATEKKMKEEPVGEDAVYPIVDINTFTIKDIKEEKTNYNLGLLEILNKFKPNVRFFTVKLMTDNMFERGYSYIYWMNINNKWVYISRPNLAFRK